jgi:transcriptional regulator GlxA family with amidase domain
MAAIDKTDTGADNRRGMKTLVALAAESCMASCPRLFADMAAYADRALGGGTVRGLVASAGGTAVRAFGGSRIEAELAIEEVDGPLAVPVPDRVRADALCLPVPLGDICLLYGSEGLVAEVARIHSQGALVAAPCASIFLLAESGILAGRRVPIHPNLATSFVTRYPGVEVDTGAPFGDEGDLLFSVGAASPPALGVMVLDRLCCALAAQAAARVFLDKAGEGRPAAGQPPDESPLAASEAVGRAAAYAEARFAQPISLADLARAAGLEERTLARRFSKRYGMSPMEYLRGVRCRAAAELLGSSSLTVAEIAWKVGYAEGSSFSRAFKAVYGRSPRALRR